MSVEALSFPGHLGAPISAHHAQGPGWPLKPGFVNGRCWASDPWARTPDSWVEAAGQRSPKLLVVGSLARITAPSYRYEDEIQEHVADPHACFIPQPVPGKVDQIVSLQG